MDFLTGRARQAIPYIESGIARGLSANQIQAELRQLDVGGLQRQRLLDIINQLSSAPNLERGIRLAGQNAPIPESLHVTAPYDLSNQYQYRISTQFPSAMAEDYLTVSSAVPLSAAVIRSKGADLFNGQTYSRDTSVVIEPDQVTILTARKTP